MRTHARRLRTFAVAVPLWIVMVLTGGQWCLMPDSGGAHPVVSSAAGVGHGVLGEHAAAHAPDVGARAGVSQHVAPHAPDGSGPGARHEGHAGSPGHAASPVGGGGGAACESQAACSVAIIPGELQLTANAAPAVPRAVAPVRARPRSIAAAPELPPPRA